MNDKHYLILILTFCMRLLDCSDSTEFPPLASDVYDETQSNFSDIDINSWREHEDWEEDRVWQNMLAVAVQDSLCSSLIMS